MRRSFGVAIAISAALHAALLLYTLDIDGPVPEPYPTLSLDLAAPDTDASALHDAKAANDSKLPAPSPATVEALAALVANPPERPPTPRRQPRVPLEKVAVAPRVVNPAPRVPPTPAPRLPQPATVAAASPSPAPVRISARRADAPRREPMSAGERAMLDARIEDWAENLDKVATTGELSFEQDGRQYTATFTAEPSTSETATGEVLIEVVTGADGVERSTKIKLRQLAFSRFAQFVDRWDRGVALHDDSVDGWLHSNSTMTIAAGWDAHPELLGKVTVARRVETQFDGPIRRSSIFRGGLETGVRRIAMPKAPGPFGGRPPSADRVRRLDTTVWLEFDADGGYTLKSEAGGAPEHEELPEAPFYFVAAPDTEVHVRGMIKGKVLVYAADTIMIDGSLRYARDPREIASSPDYLGLVADNAVIVAPPKITGPGDLTIDASIYAGRRFSVRNYGKRERATLAIYGSLTAGSLSATEPRYRTRIEFDRRLKAERPPGFPLTDRYELESWDAAWTETKQN